MTVEIVFIAFFIPIIAIFAFQEILDIIGQLFLWIAEWFN